MARKVPVSPARTGAALDAALDKAPRPAMPPGLAARIVDRATALPQLSAEPEETAHEVVRETAQVVPFPAPEIAGAAPSARASGRRLAVGGLAAIAATLVAALLMERPVDRPMVPGAPAGMVAKAPSEAPAPVTGRVEGGPAQLASAPVARNRTAPDTAPVPQQVAPTSSPVADAPATPATQLAASAPPAPRESAGPASDPAPRPSTPRGLMGPPAPQQGWGFSGGAPGGSLPGGQSLPSQTTGSAPPPPPPSGN